MKTLLSQLLLFLAKMLSHYTQTCTHTPLASQFSGGSNAVICISTYTEEPFNAKHSLHDNNNDSQP